MKVHQLLESMEYLFHEAVKKMAESKTGLWVYVTHHSNSDKRKMKLGPNEGNVHTRVHKVEILGGETPIYRLYFETPVDENYWMELNPEDGEDGTSLIGILDGKRTLMDRGETPIYVG